MKKNTAKKIMTGTIALVIGISGINYRNHVLHKPNLRADVIENAAAAESFSISINTATGGAAWKGIPTA